MKIKFKKLKGTSVDAVLLMVIKLITMTVGFAITRLLSQYLSVYDYGTYSQIMLIVSTVAMLTILGMVDGVNYFYSCIRNLDEREAYISTIYMLQCIVSAAVGILVLLLSSPLCAYFKNQQVARLLVFAAVLPVLQNMLSMTHVLIVAVGKARTLALRNLIFSFVRLGAAILTAVVVKNIAYLFLTTLLLDLVEMVWFCLVLRKNGCAIRMKQVKLRLTGQIMHYCAPMAVFTVINALNRDLDKYLIAWLTDTETLAVYANASKVLPFDIVMNAFCTVLVPHITRKITNWEFDNTVGLYKTFLEVAYISTGILCCAALAAAPQLMQLLYSEKYLSGLTVFCVYILVDLLRFTNITLILSAAGKTKTLMFLGIGALTTNAVLNVVLYRWMGVTGPAVATLLVTAIMGVTLLKLSAGELHSRLRDLFDMGKLLLFTAELAVVCVIMTMLRDRLEQLNVHYFLVLLIVGGSCGVCMLALQGKHLFRAMGKINAATQKV